MAFKVSESGVTVWIPHVLEGIRSEVDSTADGRGDVPYERVLTIHCRGKRKADGEPMPDIPTDLDEHLKAREKGFGISVYDGRPHPIYTKRVKITHREKLDTAIKELMCPSPPPASFPAPIPSMIPLPAITRFISYLRSQPLVSIKSKVNTILFITEAGTMMDGKLYKYIDVIDTDDDGRSSVLYMCNSKMTDTEFEKKFNSGPVIVAHRVGRRDRFTVLGLVVHLVRWSSVDKLWKLTLARIAQTGEEVPPVRVVQKNGQPDSYKTGVFRLFGHCTGCKCYRVIPYGIHTCEMGSMI
jgi:hypothetical protein